MRISKPTSQQRFYQLAILLAAGCLTTMTGGIVTPVFPEMVQQLQLDPSWAGTLVSIHALTTAVFTPLMGILADRVGKMRVMIPCLVLYTVFGVATPFMDTLVPILATRGLLGAASGGVAAATIGLLGSMYEGEARSRILGYATCAMTVASVLCPLIGGWLGGMNWQYAFYLYGLGVPLAAIAASGFKKDGAASGAMLAADQRQQLGKVLRQPDILKLYLFLTIGATVVYSVVIYAPLYLKVAIGAGPDLNGLVLAIRAAGAAVVSAVGASWLARRLGENRAIALGFTLMAIALVTIPFLTEVSLIILTAVLFGVGFGIITPNLYDSLADLSPPAVKASVLAIGTGFNSLGQFISPIFLGPVWKHVGLPAVFYTAAGIAIFAGCLNLMRSKKTINLVIHE
jgi:predicted MFS family arabinose efflux permease